MKQILQSLKTGVTEVVEIPVPGVSRGQLLIATSRTLVSAGTERMLVDFGKAGWIAKARQQPEKVKQVLDKIRTDGLMPTVDAVFNKLDQPLPLGYCNAGVVIDDSMVRQAHHDIKIGDRVVSNGPHAEVVCVPRNLYAKIPDGVSDDEAAFTVLASIALQGVRLAMPTLGEKFVVFGLGLVGLLTVQFLRASGCQVLAVDVSEARLRLAQSFGAATVDLSKGTDPVAAAMAWTSGRGVDGVLIAASAKGDDIVHQAAQACRKRGRIILVGVVDLNLNRNDFYEKEITFQVSCSYGPGRYDEKYEQAGQDYPFGFVRWTEQRNFEAVMEAMRSGQLRVKDLITHRLTLEEAAAAYDKVLHDPGALGIVIEYPALRQAQGDSLAVQRGSVEAQGDKDDVMVSRSNHDDAFYLSREGSANNAPRQARGDKEVARGDKVTVGVIGAGNYAIATLLPALSQTSAKLAYIADINGVNAAHAARKFKAIKAVSDYKQIMHDPAVNAVFVLVGHHLHSRFVCEIMEAGKHAFVEKPLAISEAQIGEVVHAYESVTLRQAQGDIVRQAHHDMDRQIQGEKRLDSRTRDLQVMRGSDNRKSENDGVQRGKINCHGELVEPSPFLMVGFNRRFSPHTVKIKELLAGRTEPLTMTMTVNAGFIPPEHWTQDPERGGGRIIGEGCHFIDLLAHMAGARVTYVSAQMVGGSSPVRDDKMSILLQFADGSVGTVHYFANGAKSYPKETLEIFGDGRVIRMENFRVTTGYGFKGFRSFRTWRQDKGHRAEISAFVNAVSAGGPLLIPFDEIVNATRASFAAVESARKGSVVRVNGAIS